MAGALVLFGSLFLTWSHQVSAPLLAAFGPSGALQGVPRNPTAWQVYSAADLVLMLVAVALAGAAVSDRRALRLGVGAAALLGLAFVVHALAVPPTDGVLLSLGRGHGYAATGAGAGIGETLAAGGLVAALAGLLLSRQSPPTVSGRPSDAF